MIGVLFYAEIPPNPSNRRDFLLFYAEFFDFRLIRGDIRGLVHMVDDHARLRAMDGNADAGLAGGVVDRALDLDLGHAGIVKLLFQHLADLVIFNQGIAENIVFARAYSPTIKSSGNAINRVSFSSTPP